MWLSISIAAWRLLVSNPAHMRRLVRATPWVDQPLILVGEVQRFFNQAVVGHSGRNETNLGGFGGAEVTPGKHELEGPSSADGPGKQEREPEFVGCQAVVDACCTEIGRFAGDTNVGSERQAHASADGGAVDGCDHGFVHLAHAGNEI